MKPSEIERPGGNLVKRGARIVCVPLVFDKVRSHLIIIPSSLSSSFRCFSSYTGAEIVSDTSLPRLIMQGKLTYDLGVRVVDDPTVVSLIIFQIRKLLQSSEITDPNSGLLCKEKLERALVSLKPRGGTLANLAQMRNVFLRLDLASLRESEILDLINSVNCAADDWQTMDGLLDQLVGCIVRNGEMSLAKIVTEGLRVYRIKEKFIARLANCDPNKPKFDPQVPITQILPFKEISEALGVSIQKLQAATDFVINEREIRLTLKSLSREDEILASVRILLSNDLEEELEIQTPMALRRGEPRLRPSIDAILVNDASWYFDSAPSGYIRREHYNLNWWANIIDFSLCDDLRNRGIGRDWILKHIEPFLFECGLKIAAVYGRCLDLKEVQAFWRNCGYCLHLPLNVLYDAETTVYYIYFKGLNRP